MRSELIMALGAVLIMLIVAGCTQGTSYSSQPQGRAVFTIADAAPDMGAITSVKVSMDSLQVQNSSGGWITLSSTLQTFDLMQLRSGGLQALLADANLSPGTYGQVRMHITKVIITDVSGDHETKLPSGELKIAGGFEVNANSTVEVNFDFIADQSVHMTGNGMYILAPVVRMQGRQDVQVDSSNRENVKVNGGRMMAGIEVGMDENGTVGEGRRIDPNLDLSINGDGKIVGSPHKGFTRGKGGN